MPDLTGQSIGRYHIIAPLGEGGMATVYKAFDTRLECDVAIKFIRKENVPASQWERMNARFEREAKRMAKLMHPNIVKVTDYGEYEGNPYLVMPYLPGGTLKNRSQKSMSYQQAARILAPVARALEYAHRQDTIHRDVKPANILITEDGAPMLTDFGVAKILDLGEDNTLTGTGMGVGTPKYMAPEQWLNRVSPQTDVYALGVVFYELLTGRVPYDADTPAGVMLKQNTEPLPRPEQFVAGLPDDVERVIFKALAKDPQQRYADMGALAQVLERLATLTPAPLLQAVEGKKTAVVGGQYPQSQPQARAGNQATIDYGDGIQPSSSAKSAQSEKSAVQTSSTASVWEIPTALAGQPTPAAAQREHTPIPPPYIPQPPLSAKSVKSEKSAVQTSLLLSIGGLGLLLLIVIIGGASWLLNRPSEPSSDMNAQTVQSSIRQTQSAVDKQTPTLSLKGQGEYDVNVYPTITPSITNIPLATATLHSILSRISTKDGMEMIYIPASEFLMGSTESDRFADNNEKPQHKVELNGYWMDKTEVTNGMYQKCVADGACQEPNNKSSRTHADYYKNSTYANYPVIYVDSNQAVTYCKWAGGSLPSEAQWEKAARGTDGRKYPWGDVSPSCDLANYTGCGGDTKPVGSIMAGESPYGLMDMAGNVGEWVNDWYDDGYYKNSPQLNPAGPESGLSRVVRGGSWEYDSMYVRAANRDRIFHVFWGNNLGFRCVR